MESDDVILIDGDCVLCDGFANFVATYDKGERFLFEAQQSERGMALLKEHGQPTDLSTIIVVQKEGLERKVFKRSTAVLRVLRHLTFPWYLLYFFIIIPAFIRDLAYNIVAKNRYRMFGKKGACSLPDKAMRARLKKRKQVIT